MNVAINGFGRIGRAALRAIRAQHPELHVVAIHDPAPLDVLAHLLRRDSVYGRYPEPVEVKGDALKVGQDSIAYVTRPLMPWWAHNVDMVLECAGGGPDGNKARRHLELGASKVIISAPAPNVDALLLMGVNEASYNPAKHHIISMGSCTANCIGPIVNLLNDKCDVISYDYDTLNAYTNSQRLVDAPHHDLRCMAAAPFNVIPTESSAIPVLRQLFDIPVSGRAFRLPVACGSLCVMRFNLTHLPQPNVWAEASDVIGLSDEPLVSTDIIGDTHSSIVDMAFTRVENGQFTVIAWYDNEMGYASRMADMAAYIGRTS